MAAAVYFLKIPKIQVICMKSPKTVIQRSPEILNGTPVFVGTRVPVNSLIEYLEAGDNLAEFLEDFPTVTREQAVAVLEMAKEALLEDASAA